jgi:hypothetical protein
MDLRGYLRRPFTNEHAHRAIRALFMRTRLRKTALSDRPQVIRCRRGNSMLPRLVARLRAHRRPMALIAAGLIVLQAFVAGFASARAAAITADPLGIAVICHGAGGSDPGDGTAPDPIKLAHQCCIDCMGGSPAATLPEQAVLLRSDNCGESNAAPVRAADVTIAERAIRAGQSQAPPRRG